MVWSLWSLEVRKCSIFKSNTSWLYRFQRCHQHCIAQLTSAQLHLTNGWWSKVETSLIKGRLAANTALKEGTRSTTCNFSCSFAPERQVLTFEITSELFQVALVSHEQSDILQISPSHRVTSSGASLIYWACSKFKTWKCCNPHCEGHIFQRIDVMSG